MSLFNYNNYSNHSNNNKEVKYSFKNQVEIFVIIFSIFPYLDPENLYLKLKYYRVLNSKYDLEKLTQSTNTFNKSWDHYFQPCVCAVNHFKSEILKRYPDFLVLDIIGKDIKTKENHNLTGFIINKNDFVFYDPQTNRIIKNNKRYKVLKIFG